MRTLLVLSALFLVAPPMLGPGTPDAHASEEGQAKGVVDIPLPGRLDFNLGRRTVRASSNDTLKAIAALLREHPEWTHVEVGVHTDSKGNAAKNRLLSQQRAEQVVRRLVKLGVPPQRLYAKGYGPDVPLSKGQSRRVELRHDPGTSGEPGTRFAGAERRPSARGDDVSALFGAKKPAPTTPAPPEPPAATKPAEATLRTSPSRPPDTPLCKVVTRIMSRADTRFAALKGQHVRRYNNHQKRDVEHWVPTERLPGADAGELSYWDRGLTKRWVLSYRFPFTQDRARVDETRTKLAEDIARCLGWELRPAGKRSHWVHRPQDEVDWRGPKGPYVHVSRRNEILARRGDLQVWINWGSEAKPGDGTRDYLQVDFNAPVGQGR